MWSVLVVINLFLVISVSEKSLIIISVPPVCFTLYHSQYHQISVFFCLRTFRLTFKRVHISILLSDLWLASSINLHVLDLRLTLVFGFSLENYMNHQYIYIHMCAFWC